MKKAFRIALVVLVLLAVLLTLGIRRGLTPMPTPPPGVRLEPELRRLAVESLARTNGAFFYTQAVGLVRDYRLARDAQEQMDALLAGRLPETSEAIRKSIGDCHEALLLAREGSRAQSCQMPWKSPERILTPYRSGLRLLARLLCSEGRLASQDGDFTQAVESYLTAIQLASDVTRGGPLAESFLAHSISAPGCFLLRQVVIEHPPSVEDAARLIARLESARMRHQPLAETLRYERLYLLELFESTRTNLPWTSAIVFSERVYRRLADAAYGDYIGEAENRFWEADMDRVAEKWDPQDRSIWVDLLNRPLAMSLVRTEVNSINEFAKTFTRSEVELQATRVVCAVQAHVGANGSPPETLGELVPHLLPAVPTDPFDGQPLRYSRDSDAWVVWSVGKDRKDDRAARHEFKYPDGRGTDDGGDIYFKSSELRDDLEWRRKQAERLVPAPTPIRVPRS